MDNIDLDEETLQQMLGLSTVPEERTQLGNQLKMAQMLARGATDYNPYVGRGRNARANVGGFAGALAQGMQGYMAGQGMKENKAEDALLRARERRGREQWFRSRYGANKGLGGGVSAATPNSMYDPGQPEVSILPPDDNLPYDPNIG